MFTVGLSSITNPKIKEMSDGAGIWEGSASHYLFHGNAGSVYSNQGGWRLRCRRIWAGTVSICFDIETGEIEFKTTRSKDNVTEECGFSDYKAEEYTIKSVNKAENVTYRLVVTFRKDCAGDSVEVVNFLRT